MWTALKTVDRRARIFWCVEAVYLSVVLSLVGVVWVGDPLATAPDGLDVPDESDWGFGWSYLEMQAIVFNWPFVCLTAPLGATIGAWEVALVLQLIADNFDDGVHAANYSPLVKYVAALEVVSVVDWGGAMISSGVPGGLWLINHPIFYLISIPLFLFTVGACLAIPCCRRFISADVSKAMVGMGLGFVVTSLATGCHYIATMREYLGGSMSAGDFIADGALAVFSLAIWRYLLAAVQVSLSNPSACNILGWGFKRAICATSGVPDAEAARPTVAGIFLFVLTLNTRVYFGWVVCHTIKHDVVRL